jgi:hypothetical protein
MAKSGRSRARSATSTPAGGGAPKKRARLAKTGTQTVPAPAVGKAQSDVQRDERMVTCRSCGKRPGRPTAIIGQMMAAELCSECATLRKERIRQNRAAARGLRPGSFR